MIAILIKNTETYFTNNVSKKNSLTQYYEKLLIEFDLLFYIGFYSQVI
jgi:hypothetical protein